MFLYIFRTCRHLFQNNIFFTFPFLSLFPLCCIQILFLARNIHHLLQHLALLSCRGFFFFFFLPFYLFLMCSPWALFALRFSSSSPLFSIVECGFSSSLFLTTFLPFSLPFAFYLCVQVRGVKCLCFVVQEE